MCVSVKCFSWRCVTLFAVLRSKNLLIVGVAPLWKEDSERAGLFVHPPLMKFTPTPPLAPNRAPCMKFRIPDGVSLHFRFQGV